MPRIPPLRTAREATFGTGTSLHLPGFGALEAETFGRTFLVGGGKCGVARLDLVLARLALIDGKRRANYSG
jgi:hypothetical protein